MDGFNEKKWFVYLTDHHEGPFSLAEIQGKMAQSQVTTANYIWAEGMTDWKPMTAVPEFEALLSAPSLQPAAGAEMIGAPAATSNGAATSGSASADSIPNELTLIQPKSALQIEAETLSTTNPGLAAQPILTEPTQGLIKPREPEKVIEADLTGPSIQVDGAGEAPAPARKRPSRALKWVIALAVPAALALAYMGGSLDPVLADLKDLVQPQLVKLSEKVPVLKKWVSPLPPLEDVTPEDYEQLKEAAQAPLEGSPRLAVAVSTADAFAPSFYVASNLPDGAVIDVYVEGIPDTLLNHLAFSSRVQTTITQKLGKTGAVRFADGKPLPRGEYVVYAAENAEQPENIKAILAGMPATSIKAAAILPHGLKLLVSKPVFLGGARDATYDSRLKDFHDKLRAKAQAELAEIKQLTMTIEGQLASTTSKYNQLRSLSPRGARPSAAARKAWTVFDGQWNKLNEQLTESYAKWTDLALDTEYFYGMLYKMTRQAGESVSQLHQMQKDFFDGKADPKAFEIQHGSAVSGAENAVAALKAKVAQAENMAPTPNGMPRREGL